MCMKKILPRVLALALVFAQALCPAALADESTTTFDTAYKDNSANTEIYLVTQAPGSDYPSFHARWEPSGGVYFGRTIRGGTLPDGSYGLVNRGEMEEESAISYYYDLNDSYSLEYWSYLFGPALEEGKRAFLVYLNFPGEGAFCERVASGALDGKLQETFAYLGTLTCPVFVRIGGEVNVWDDRPQPERYIAAYRHAAGIARGAAPNAALVFSPNYSSAYEVDMDSFYPGDDCVDWVGVSLYYNRYSNNGDRERDQFYGVGVYGDALLNVQQVVNLSKLHSKPVIVTEGGSSNKYGEEDASAWAAERLAKAMSCLTMVYPQIKCIISSDYGLEWAHTDYTFYDNAAVTAAYRKAVSGNPTLLSACGGAASYYTKASAFQGPWEGKVELAAYTYAPEKQVGSWFVDGVWKASLPGYPYSYTLDTSTLSAGEHTLRVVFENGAEKSVKFQVGAGQAASAPGAASAAVSAVPTNDKLYVDGVLQAATVYKIDGSNYFKLRDLGQALDFSVGYDPALGVSVSGESGYNG